MRRSHWSRIGLARGDYDSEALILKMAAARFVDVFEEERNKMSEKQVSQPDNHLSNCTNTNILLRLSEYCRIIIRQYSLRLR